MADYNVRGKHTIRKILSDISEQIESLEVTDPRLENLRQLTLNLSIKIEEIEARLTDLERHEATGVQFAKIAALVIFILIVTYLSRFL